MKSNKASAIGFTDRALDVCKDVKLIMDAKGYVTELLDGRKVSISGKMEEMFRGNSYIIFVSAAGIAVRMIAPHIKSKDSDPGVIAIDEGKNFAISLLSGHLGGANEITAGLAKALGAVPVITTATDVNGKFAVDLWTKSAGCVIEDIGMIKYVSSAVLKNERVGICPDFEIEGDIPEELELSATGDVGISVSLSGGKTNFARTLNAIPRIVTIGAGCRRNTEPEKFKAFILEVMAKENISIKAVERLASIDLKKDEKCMIETADSLGIPFITYSARELENAGERDSAGQLFDSSDFVKKTTGTDNVCEKSAYLGSDRGKIIMKKKSLDGMTVSLAVRDWKCRF